MLTREDRLRTTLINTFAPTSLEVVDDSAQHAGHAGASAAGETHYSVRMVSAVFAGMNRVARSRAVHAALQTEFDSGLHALSLTLHPPGEPPGT